MKKRAKVLFVAAYLPSDGIPAAGNKLSAIKLKELRDECAQVDVVTFKKSRDLEDVIRGPDVNENTFVLEVSILHRIYACVRYPFLPFGVGVRLLLGASIVRELLQQTSYDDIYVDFTQAAALVPTVLRFKSTLRVHDVMTQLYRRKGQSFSISGLIYRFEAWRCAKYETSIVSSFGKVIALTEKDRDILTGMTGTSKVLVQYPEHYYKVFGRSKDTIVSNTILFWGNYSRYENVDAALFMVEEILPLIRGYIPEVRMIFAGANPPVSNTKLIGSKVEWTGYVDSPDELFRSCALGVVPLRQGAGLKIKTLELVFAKVPTVSTFVGAEGVNPSPFLYIEDDPKSFALKCVQILRSRHELIDE